MLLGDDKHINNICNILIADSEIAINCDRQLVSRKGMRDHRVDAKRQVREVMRERRNDLQPEIKSKLDAHICDQLVELVRERNSHTVHCYLPMDGEIDIRPFIEYLLSVEAIVVCSKTLQDRQLEHYRLFDLDRVETGFFGTSHPLGDEAYTGDFDLIIVPGLAFDSEGYRLGYGGGYYDTFLAEHPNAYTVGVAYPFQLVDQVPTEPHDAILDQIIVPK